MFLFLSSLVLSINFLTPILQFSIDLLFIIQIVLLECFMRLTNLLLCYPVKFFQCLLFCCIPSILLEIFFFHIFSIIFSLYHLGGTSCFTRKFHILCFALCLYFSLPQSLLYRSVGNTGYHFEFNYYYQLY